MRRGLVLIFLIITLLPLALSEKCEQAWKCDGEFRRYRNSGCEILVEEYCKYGCTPDGCIEVDLCTVEWKCNGNFREHITEDCKVDSRMNCQYGCRNATCQPLPEEKTAEEPDEEIISAPAEAIVPPAEETNQTNLTQAEGIPEIVPAQKQGFFARLFNSIKSILTGKLNLFVAVKNE